MEHARGWVATKMGLLDILASATMIEINRALVNSTKANDTILFTFPQISDQGTLGSSDLERGWSVPDDNEHL